MTPLVRSASLTNYAAVARAAGLDPRAMLRAAGLARACLDNPDLKISALATGRLLEASARQSGCEDFGLRMAESRQFQVLGPLALLVREQATLRQAIDALIRYMRIHNESLHVWLEEDVKFATIHLGYLGRGAEVRQSMELSMGMLYRLLKQALPESWEAQRVCFMHDPPADMRTARRVFTHRVSYREPFNGIVCRSGDLALPLSSYARLDRYVQQYVESVEGDVSYSMSDKVRHLVLTLLPAATCSLKAIAGHLGVEERTVRRHLGSEGKTYQDLLDEVRRELAMRYLNGAPRKQADIALLLGFTGPTTFSRWFRAHFGETAGEWVQSHIVRESGEFD